MLLKKLSLKKVIFCHVSLPAKAGYYRGSNRKLTPQSSCVQAAAGLIAKGLLRRGAKFQVVRRDTSQKLYFGFLRRLKIYLDCRKIYFR